MKNKIIALILILSILIAMLSYLFYRYLVAYVNVLKTYDTFGQIFVALDKLQEEEFIQANITNAIMKHSHDLFASNPNLFDAWGNHIAVSLKTDKNNSFKITIISIGKDGIIGTKDDLIQECSVGYGVTR